MKRPWIKKILDTLFLFLTRRLSHLEQGCNMKWNNVPNIPLSILPFLVHYKLFSMANSSFFVSFFLFFSAVFFFLIALVFFVPLKDFFAKIRYPKMKIKFWLSRQNNYFMWIYSSSVILWVIKQIKYPTPRLKNVFSVLE